ncbi:lymphocyte function-associated antigen 3 isoform X2 [Pelecanus crispus]|uniref:lymphocyte function-associated antigen 3 isoform X2 n=1 Tax=Pelecanus crispus TaxID=36300 RepID=UPI003F5D338B
MGLPAWLVWLLLFGCLLAHICCEDVFGIVGETFAFPVKIDQKIREIIWTKNKDKVAEWEGQNQPTYFTSLRSRGLLDTGSGGLTIFNLEKSDSGMYMLEYLDSGKKNEFLTFSLAVLDPPSEPEIRCNFSGDNLVLTCIADFQQPLNYTWKFSSMQKTSHSQEVSIPKNVDASEKASCFIKFSQTEKSSGISLTQCFPDQKGYSYHKRSRGGLIAAFVLLTSAVVILGVLYRRARTKLGTRGAAQNNSTVHDSGEHQRLCSVDSQEQPNSDRATPSQAVGYDNEKPEADKELNKEDSALKDEQTVNSGIKQEELSTKQNSTLTSSCAVDHGETEGALTPGYG